MEKKFEALDERASKYADEARQYVQENPNALDPEKVLRIGGSVLKVLEDAEREDNTPEFVLIPNTDKVRWSALLGAMLKKLLDELGGHDARIPEAGALSDVDRAVTKDAMQNVDDVRHELGRAIDGNGSRKKQAAENRARIFGGRTVQLTKAALLTELELEMAPIRSDPDSFPPAVVAMLSKLEEAHARLKAAPDLTPGKKKKGTRWSASVLQAAAQAHLLSGDVIAWSAPTALPRRKAVLNRLSASGSKRRGQKDAVPDEGEAHNKDVPLLPAAKKDKDGQ